MKVCLFGDFSSVAYNLKQGLEKTGIDVLLISSGDSFKKIKNDLSIQSKNKVLRFLNYLKALKRTKNYDVVQIINQGYLIRRFLYKYPFNVVKKNNNKIFLSACGTTTDFLKLKDKFDYFPYDDTYKPKYSSSFIKVSSFITDNVDGIIPNAYSYAESYRDRRNLLETVPFPIEIDGIPFSPQKIAGNKLKIFHGLSREKFKGTKFIKEAMFKIKEKYPDDVDIKIDGRMPLKKYLNVLQDANIVIDQALSYGYGMNAIYSMAMGKVVFSGNEPETQREFNRYDIPVINILPDSKDIYNKLEYFVRNKKEVEKMGYESRKFVEDFHDCKKVAQRYINVWNLA